MNRHIRQGALAITMALGVLSSARTAHAESWSVVSGSPPMSAIAAGPNGTAWAIGTTPWTPGSPDKTIFRRVGSSWVAAPGGAIQVAVAPDSGTPWIVNTGGVVFNWNGSAWSVVTTSPAISSIGVGPYNNVWAIGTTPWEPGSPDKTIYKLEGQKWVPHQGGAIQVSVSPDNANPWIVNTGGTVFELANGNWSVVNPIGPAMSWIAAGPNNYAVGISTTAWTPGSPDKGIFSSAGGATWTNQTGGAVKVAMSPTGEPWIVNTGGTVFDGTTPIAGGGCEFSPGFCTATTSNPNVPGFLDVTCSGFGNGAYSISLSTDGTNWVGNSDPDIENPGSIFPNPYTGNPQIQFPQLDEDSIYLSTCNIHTGQGCSIVAHYVQVCADTGSVCSNAPGCVIANVTAE